jgi:hypothetical protein
MSAPLLIKETVQRPAAALWVEPLGDQAASLLARWGERHERPPYPNRPTPTLFGA